MSEQNSKLQKDMEGLKGEGDGQGEITDKCKVAYIIHFFLGAGNLLPWNALITAVDYFGYLYPGKNIEKVFSVAYMSSSVLVLVLMISWGVWSKITLRIRMNLGISMFIVSLMVAPVLDWAWHGNVSNERPKGAYGVTVASVVICGLADGLVGGSLIGSAGKLPRQYMQAVFAGTASSGTAISMLRILTKASLPQTPKGLQTSSHLYFMAGTIFLLCCLLFSNLLYELPVMQRHYRLIQEEPLFSGSKLLELALKIRCPAFGIFIIYVVTLSIFPGFIAENLESKLLKDWYPIILITIYNIADLLGKSLTALYVLKSIKWATFACTARLLFYPLFITCLHGPEWLKTEIPVVLLTFMLGLTNGYLTSVIMILAPKSVQVWEAELAAVAMAVFLGIGLVGGSVLGWFWII